MTNLIMAVSQQFRRALNSGALESSRASLDRAVGELADYMLFVDEAPLHDPIRGVSTFTETFPQRGPRDKRGRSLRDFELQKRLFRYSLSYMIYSDSFEAMPSAARDRIYKRLYDVLTGRDQSAKFAHLSEGDRTAILQILTETKPNLPEYWNAPAVGVVYDRPGRS
jgi:hypothetical protein